LLAACRLSDSPVESLKVFENCKASSQADDGALPVMLRIPAIAKPATPVRRPLPRVA